MKAGRQSKIESDSDSRPNLYLVGFMGTGKSAVGRRVAYRLKLAFMDSDREIEHQAGKPIPKIFADEGEVAFRAMERRFVEGGHPATGHVVSCGGGLVVQDGLLEMLKERGVVVCLFASIETIIERTCKNENRPLLSVDDREARIRELLEERTPIYRSAGTGITTENRTITDVVAHVIRVYETESKAFARQTLA